MGDGTKSAGDLACIRWLAQIERQSIQVSEVVIDTRGETNFSLASSTVARKKFEAIRKDNVMLPDCHKI